MDYEDDGLPCGGYEGEDEKIQANMEALSLETQKKQEEKQKKERQDKQEKKKCCKKELKQEKKQLKKSQKCKKCKQNNSVLVHKNEPICQECLLKNIQYKTRLTLQNTIKVKQNSKLLLCFSGGLNSICLVDIISKIQKRYQKHHLFGMVECIHIQQQENLPENYKQIFQQATDFKLNIIPISQVMDGEKTLENVRKLFSLFPKNANSIDLLQMMRNRLILKFAEENKFDLVLQGLNGQTLASQIFKLFTKGVGGNITNICSSGGPFEYPLRQHLQKQLQYYFYSQKLGKISMKAEPDDLSYCVSKEIDNHLDSFISILQDRYSHTAPAIVRTGQKVKISIEKENNCSWCYMKCEEVSKCRKCQRLKEALKGQMNEVFPNWLKN